MKVNYPIKYTAMPIIEQVGWNHGLNELERAYGIVYYIVSKSYLLEERKRYDREGKEKKEYEVCFPFQHAEYDKYEREIPTYNLLSNNCTNSSIVGEIFETPEDARIYVDKLNEKLLEKAISELSYMPLANEEQLKRFLLKKEEIENEFVEREAKYKLLENVIGLKSDNISEFDDSTYDFIKTNDIQGPVLSKEIKRK